MICLDCTSEAPNTTTMDRVLMLSRLQVILLAATSGCLQIIATQNAHAHGVAIQCTGAGETMGSTTSNVLPNSPFDVFYGQTRNYAITQQSTQGNTTTTKMASRAFRAGLIGRLTLQPKTENTAILSGSIACTHFTVAPGSVLNGQPTEGPIDDVSVNVTYGQEVTQKVGDYTFQILVE